MSRPVSRALAIALAGSAILASCGSATAESQGQIEVTKIPTEADATTTTAPPAVDETPDPTYRPPPALPNGSGCTTTQTEGLPAGRWFGYLIETDASSFTFDLACEFTGSQALLAADEDDDSLGSETVFIRNDIADRRIVETNPGISINELDEDGGEDVQTGSFYPQWFVSSPTGIAVWVTMDPSRVRSITLAS